MTALDFALKDIAAPVRETGGNNRSPRIDAINRFVGNPIGAPYCAAGVSWCLHAAGAEGFPFSGGSQFIRGWFEERGRLSWDVDDLLKWRGALFGWSNGDGHGHIGFVAKRFQEAGHVLTIGTAEYNTDKAGSRDGEGAYALTRSLQGPHRIWFLDVSAFTGGAWWPPTLE